MLVIGETMNYFEGVLTTKTFYKITKLFKLGSLIRSVFILTKPTVIVRTSKLK